MFNAGKISQGTRQTFESGSPGFAGGALQVLNGNTLLKTDNAFNLAYQTFTHDGSDANGLWVDFDLYSIGNPSGQVSVDFAGHSITIEIPTDGETSLQKGDGVYARVTPDNSSTETVYKVEFWVPNVKTELSDNEVQFAVAADGQGPDYFAFDNLYVDYADTAKRDTLLVDAQDAKGEAEDIVFPSGELSADNIVNAWDSVRQDMNSLQNELREFSREIVGGVFRDEAQELAPNAFKGVVDEVIDSMQTWTSEIGTGSFDERTETLWRLMHDNSAESVPNPSAMDSILFAGTVMFGLSSGFALAGIGASATALAAASTATGGAGSAGFLISGTHSILQSKVDKISPLPAGSDIEVGLDAFLFIEDELDRRVEQGTISNSLRQDYLDTVNTAHEEFLDFQANAALMQLLSSEAQKRPDHLEGDVRDAILDLGFDIRETTPSTPNGGVTIYRTEIISGDRQLEADAVRWVFKDRDLLNRWDSVRIEVNPLGEEGWL